MIDKFRCSASLFSGAAKETEQLTPERVLQESVKESQRLKLAELESERNRTEESDRRKEEERLDFLKL
jgi:hypothetical protein